MTTEEKIATAERRIQELTLLISHWKKTNETTKTNSESLSTDKNNEF